MKRLAYFLLFALLLASCTTVKQIGKVNMISMRNIDPNLKYQPLTTYSGGKTSERERSTAKTIEDAIDQTVRNVPGGEFLMNAKIYLVNREYFTVEGDVWGSPSQASFRGFKVGDKVTWKDHKRYITGTISGLKDDKICLVKSDNEPEKTIELAYEEITKTDKEPLIANEDTTAAAPIKNQSAGNCFIATACYGNYDTEEVKILRQYRDSVLLKSGLGRSLVSTYYFLSPPFAKLLEQSEPSKAFVRKYVLAPIIETIKENQ